MWPFRRRPAPAPGVISISMERVARMALSASRAEFSRPLVASLDAVDVLCRMGVGRRRAESLVAGAGGQLVREDYYAESIR